MRLFEFDNGKYLNIDAVVSVNPLRNNINTGDMTITGVQVTTLDGKSHIFDGHDAYRKFVDIHVSQRLKARQE